MLQKKEILPGVITIKSHRINTAKLLIFILLSFLPFYLPLRFIVSNRIIYIQDGVVLFLTLGLLLKKTIKQKTYWTSRMDFVFFLFLFYSVMLLSLSLLKGGILLSLQHFHNFIPGILMYFLVRDYFEDSDTYILLRIYLITSMVVAGVYIYEWINMNVLGKDALSWTLAFFEEYGVGKQFLVKGHSGFIRPMGLIGYSHATGIFIGGGIVILLSQAICYKKKSVNYLFIGIGAIAVMLTASRTAVIGTFLAAFFILVNSNLNILSLIKKHIIPIVSLTFVVIVFQQYLRRSSEFILLWNFLSGSLSGSEYNKSIFEVFYLAFEEDLSQLMRIIEHFPLALLTGAGYPVYSDNRVLNPIITNHNYFLMWITQYGVYGCAIAGLLIFLSGKRIIKNLKNPSLSLRNRCTLLSIYGIIFLFMISTLHSSSLKFYPLYYWFFILLGLVGNFPKIRGNGTCQ